MLELTFFKNFVAKCVKLSQNEKKKNSNIHETMCKFIRSPT